jgi:mono/diheme cytochrome c family protein
MARFRAFLFLVFPAILIADNLDFRFQKDVRPILNRHCVSCHGGKAPAAQLDLRSVTDLKTVTKDFPRWLLVSERLHLQDMPPKPLPTPPAAERDIVQNWIRDVRAVEIQKHSGDPGIVPARRLTNAEYDNTIRDITGQALRPTREFPIDPANSAGFDNSAESLTLSPALLNKYLQAARDVASHVAFLPDRLEFAPHPMLVETDREKYAVQRILDFYRRQPTGLSHYFAFARTYRAGMPIPPTLSAKYFPQVWKLLQEPHPVGPIAKLQRLFRDPQTTPEQIEAFVKRLRLHTSMQFAAPAVAGLPAGSQPLLNWKNREFATHRRQFDRAALRNDTDPPPVVPEIPRYPGLHREAAPRWAALLARSRANDEDLIVPAAQRGTYEAAFARFANVFPDHFFVSERGRFFPDDSQDKGRHLSAGFHNVHGFFRDDQPLMELILDTRGAAELNRLWREFDFVAAFTERTWTQFYFNQSGEVQGKGAESGSLRPVGKSIYDATVISAMRDAYLAKAAADPANDPIAARAIQVHFDTINQTLRSLETAHRLAEPLHVRSLLAFARRAYRRPLAATEQNDLAALYQSLRTKNELSHADAIRECVVSILMSPDFLYRLDSSTGAPPLVTLSATSLASRLSYFLWASAPDEALLQAAANGSLLRPTVLLSHARRMMQDPKVRGLATEFGGHWLQFRRFESNNSVDRQRFPEFTPDLRAAMFEEPVRLLEDALRRNRPAIDLLLGKDTFVNATLAKHYGIPFAGTDWAHIPDATPQRRGGLLPMAVFLTQNSPGLRTSPVKRGNWLVQRILGETVPPPPPSVPELPEDEATSELPVRQMLAKHRENAACSGCHSRIDPYGIAFEGYGPVGNLRDKDLAGRAVETQVTYPGGVSANGVEGLRTVLANNRQVDFVRNLSRKLIAYSLNRSLILSDEELVERMLQRASANQYRLQALIETIVLSTQFRRRRIEEHRNHESN